MVGLNVLTTRETLGFDHLQALLLEQGASVTSVPTIELGPPKSWEPFDQLAANLDRFDWALFTSINAVKQTLIRLSTLGLKMPKKIKIAAVGRATAKQVQQAGWNTPLVPEDFQAEGLLYALGKLHLKDQQFFFPRAQEAREFLPQQLSALGAQVSIVPVYCNQMALNNQDRLKAAVFSAKIDWITFTSSSTANNFVALLGELPNTLPKLASIGKITSQALLDLGLRPTVTAVPQTLDGLVKAIIDYESKHPRIPHS